MGNDYLTHHGILGMKWGVRRYQNKDGTLTPAGKSDYNRDVQELPPAWSNYGYKKETISCR